MPEFVTWHVVIATGTAYTYTWNLRTDFYKNYENIQLSFSTGNKINL